MPKDIEADPYPGSQATVSELMELAETYQSAALTLYESALHNGTLSYAPARLCSIQGIELCLNAFMRHNGATASEVRARMHDLVDPKFSQTLRLKKRTAEHLGMITERREYLISRYAPDLVSNHTELTKLRASLNDVVSKSKSYFDSTKAL